MEGSLGFRLFFVGKRECVVEVAHIDFDNIKKQLEDGKSVFMTSICEVN